MNALFLIALAATILLTAPTADSATLLAYEDFAYGYGELDGQNGGMGFAGGWSADTANTEIADPGTALSYAGGAEVINGGAEALRITGNNARLIFRDLASALSGDEVFVSFLFRFDGAIDDNDFVALWHGASDAGSHTNDPSLGVKANREDGSGPEDVMARVEQGGGSEVYTVDLVAGQTHLILGRLFKSTPGIGNDYDRFDLWVDPTAGASATPDLTSTGSGSLSSFSTIGVRAMNIDAGDAFWIDEIRYASSFEIATVPEPSTALLVACGLVGLALRCRRA